MQAEVSIEDEMQRLSQASDRFPRGKRISIEANGVYDRQFAAIATCNKYGKCWAVTAATIPDALSRLEKHFAGDLCDYFDSGGSDGSD